jgi:hypothetical protein
MVLDCAMGGSSRLTPGANPVAKPSAILIRLLEPLDRQLDAALTNLREPLRRRADCDPDAPWPARQCARHPFRGLFRRIVLAHRETPDSIATADRYLLLMDSVADVGYYLAEWYLPELTEQSVDDVVAKLDVAAVSVSDEGTSVRLIDTLAVPTDEVLYGVFGAQSPDIVTATCQQAGVPHQRLSGHIGTRIREQTTAAG